MNLHTSSSNFSDAVESAAAEWVLRHDRGLSAAEFDEFSQWLAADPRHGAAWAEHRWGWDELDRLAGLQSSEQALPDPDLLAPTPRKRQRPRSVLHISAAALALAAAVVVGLFVGRPAAPSARPVEISSHVALIEQRELPDGSVIELNRGAVVSVHYSDGERRVRLERGEAHFSVAKDAARPFFVEAGNVAVRAVGTAFNVRLESASVEVLVTEGRVGIERLAAAASAIPSAEPVHLSIGERTVVSLAASAPVPEVAQVPAAEIEARLAWKPQLLDFTAQPLAEIVAEFNRRNPVRISLSDPTLGALRLSAAFRSDNVEGFVRLMESDFGMRAERGADGVIVLQQR